MNYLERLEKHGYGRDAEAQLREIETAGSGRTMATSAANQLKHLKTCLSSLVALVEKDKSIEKTDFVIEQLNNAKEALEA